MPERLNISADYDWVGRIAKRFKETRRLIPERQERLYQSIGQEWVGGKTVIDIGCSIGVGTNILSANNARFTWGIDINRENIEFAMKAFRRPNLDFAVLDIENPPSRPISTFEVVVMSEVIEHVSDLPTAINTVKRFFAPGTVGFITAPNQNNPMVVENEAKHGLHIQKWTAGEYYAFLTEHFGAVTLYSADRINTWGMEETIDGNSGDYLMIAKVENVK